MGKKASNNPLLRTGLALAAACFPACTDSEADSAPKLASSCSNPEIVFNCWEKQREMVERIRGLVKKACSLIPDKHDEKTDKIIWGRYIQPTSKGDVNVVLNFLPSNEWPSLGDGEDKINMITRRHFAYSDSSEREGYLFVGNSGFVKGERLEIACSYDDDPASRIKFFRKSIGKNMLFYGNGSEEVNNRRAEFGMNHSIIDIPEACALDICGNFLLEQEEILKEFLAQRKSF